MREETVNDGRLCWREPPNLFWTDYTKEELTEKLIKLALNQNINGVLIPRVDKDTEKIIKANEDFHRGAVHLKSPGQKCDKLIDKDILYGP